MKNLFFVLMALCLSSFASVSNDAPSNRICVRSYPRDEGTSPCDRFPQSYTFVEKWKAPSDEATGICTRSYGPSYCEISPKEYRWVLSVDGKSICTVHYDQKGIAQLCKDLPDFYDWAQEGTAP